MDRRKLILTGLAAATPLAAGSLSGCATSQPGQGPTGPSYPIRSDQQAPAYTAEELVAVGSRELGIAAEAMGGMEILIHCAGITRDNLALRMNDEEWQDVIDINLGVGFRLARASLRGMMKARWGRILFVTSVVGATGNPGQANYAASKSGLTGLAKALAAEVASRGVTVNCVAPGFIETAMTEALNETQRERIVAAIPAAHIGAVADVAAGCVYLASDEAAYVTGQTLHINGGMAMF